MCTPAFYVVSTMLSVAMSVKSSQDQADFEEGKSKYNARVAENTAQRTRDVGTEKENLQRLKTARLLSKQRAELGA